MVALGFGLFPAVKAHLVFLLHLLHRGAAGGVEDLAVAVADVVGLAAGVVLGVADAQGPAVGADDDGAQLVSAQDADSCVPQALEGFFVGHAVAVALPHADDGHLGLYGVQKRLGGGGVAAVVAHLEHVGLDIGPGIQDILLGLGLGVAGEEEGGIPQGDFEHDGEGVEPLVVQGGGA